MCAQFEMHVSRLSCSCVTPEECWDPLFPKLGFFDPGHAAGERRRRGKHPASLALDPGVFCDSAATPSLRHFYNNVFLARAVLFYFAVVN